MHGFHNRGELPVPFWAKKLANLYYPIRVEGRNKTKRRLYYRLVAAEKLRLAEAGIEQELINAVCRYLSDLKVVSGRRVMNLIQNPSPQSSIRFYRF